VEAAEHANAPGAVDVVAFKDTVEAVAVFAAPVFRVHKDGDFPVGAAGGKEGIVCFVQLDLGKGFAVRVGDVEPVVVFAGGIPAAFFPY
jgi:hypothetical protein